MGSKSRHVCSSRFIFRAILAVNTFIQGSHLSSTRQKVSLCSRDPVPGQSRLRRSRVRLAGCAGTRDARWVIACWGAVRRWPAGSGGTHHVGASVSWCELFCAMVELVSLVVKSNLANLIGLSGGWQTSLILLCFLSLLTVGPLTITFRVLHSERTIIKKNPFVQSGGRYRPPHCVARYKSAILVAYRNQEKHLHHLLYYIHPFLQRQQLSYSIYLIQQVTLNWMCLVV